MTAYLAMPFTAPNKARMQRNVDACKPIAGALWEAGIIVLAPLLKCRNL
jgi:hypothetical protein